MSGMNFLERLLDGVVVEWKPLWQVTTWDKRFNAVDRNKQPNVINYSYLLAADLFKLERGSGDVFLLSTGERTGWTTEELAGSYLREGEVITIPWGKSRPVMDVLKYYKGRFVTADNRIATSNDIGKLLNKYLYYWMLKQSLVIDGFYRGSGIKHPSMADVLDMQIPIPPLKIQAEIVRILDTFTALTAELTAELSDRKKQYEYYRDRLLTFGDEVPVMQLSQCCVSIADGDHQAPPQTNIGIPFITISNVSNSYQIDFTNTKFVSEAYYSELDDKRKARKNDILYTVVGSFGIPVFIDDNRKFTFQRHIAILRPNGNVILPKYLYHVLRSSDFLKQAYAVAVGAAQKTITLTALNRMKVPVPSLEEQARIIAILDKFDTLTHSISEGLPREIALRQKQYEYYRDLLLSFPPPLTPP